MKILSSSQLREADRYTILHEPVSSLALMERAGKACVNWLTSHVDTRKPFVVVCGQGNNGGDGLVIARLLAGMKLNIRVMVLVLGKPTPEFTSNLEAIKKAGVQLELRNEGETLSLPQGGILIDAIFGSGLSRAVEGWPGTCIEAINRSQNEVISIDLPSGLFDDKHSTGKVVHANHTLTFQNPKLAFYFPENEKYTGDFHVLDIGLDKQFIAGIVSRKNFVKADDVKKMLQKRNRFSHKGNFGHSLLIAGSMGKIGAAVLAARACLRTGTGLLTVHVPRCGYQILQTSLPEAMVDVDAEEYANTGILHLTGYDAVGVGPGIGTEAGVKEMLQDLIGRVKSPMVFDADALNILSANQEMLKLIPPFSILTPHPGEFERLAGKSADDFERHGKQIAFSEKYRLVLVLKGAYTCITTPRGEAFFNSTGNPGMAKGGSGDALTGMLLALLAQGYEPSAAAILGVYLHGLAGDTAAAEKGVYAMICSDLIECIPAAFDLLG